MITQEEKIVAQLERTNKLITRLENQRYLQMIDKPFKFLMMSFMQGIAVALGSTLGVAIVLYSLSLILHKLEIVGPINETLLQIQHLLENISSKN